MRVKIDYGYKGVEVEVPEKNLVKILSMKPSSPIENPEQAVQEALQNPIGSKPLSEIAAGKKDACIVICDITRPVPNKILLPPILNTLENCGIARDNITILIATGIHRPNLGEELNQLVGEDIARNYRVINHYAKNFSDHIHLGKTSRGTDVFLDKTYVNAELKITTGFIEPHLMAGFSGGRKLICPGIASLETVKVMHSPKILEHENAREGKIDGNPFHEEVMEMVEMAGMDFMVNVSLNEDRQIVGIFAGNYITAHAEGVKFVREHVADYVPEPVDIVITSSAGAPLDASFYQSVKGMTAALPILKENGTIIIAAECKEGIGSPEFTELVKSTSDLNDFIQKISSGELFVVDQWQLEEFAKVRRKAEVLFYSENLKQKDFHPNVLKIIPSLEEGIKIALKKHGKDASIAVIPRGPYVLAELATE